MANVHLSQKFSFSSWFAKKLWYCKTIIFLNHNANLDFDKIPHGRDRPTDRPTVADFCHAQKSGFLFYLFKKRVIFGTKKKRENDPWNWTNGDDWYYNIKLKTLCGKEFSYFFGFLVFRNQKAPFLFLVRWVGLGRVGLGLFLAKIWKKRSCHEWRIKYAKKKSSTWCVLGCEQDFFGDFEALYLWGFSQN